MIERCSRAQMEGMGFSFALPSWLKNIAVKAVQGTTVSVPTPAGPVNVDLGNPQSVAAAKAALTGTKISTTVGQRPTTPLETVNQAVTTGVPGGWLTIAGAAVLAIIILPRVLRK